MDALQPVLYVKSAYERPSEAVQAVVRQGGVVVIDQRDLTAALLLAHGGLITGNQVDQDHLLGLKEALAGFLDAGGRWFFNGHLVRPLVDGLELFRPLKAPKRPDLDLSSVTPHPIFAGVDLKQLEENKGVAGFYGRGCNPPPAGAVVVNGLGPSQVPVDWVWSRPRGGSVFSHSGNDLGSLGREWGLAPELTRRIIAWAAGAFLDPMGDQGGERKEWPWAEAPVYPGHRTSDRLGPRVVGVSCGTYYHIHSLEGPAYGSAFDVICSPEALGANLRPQDLVWIPCRTPAHRMMAVKDVLHRHLASGGTVVALGESHSDLWLPGVSFTSTPTNWWWWREPRADLGVEVTEAAGSHPLMRDIGKREVTWHLHGWFEVPQGATVLAHNREGQAIFYEDRVTTAGTMILSSLDPFYHHGSHFMPATTRFLDRFVPNVRALAHA